MADVLVTGSSSGIGKLSALEFARRGLVGACIPSVGHRLQGARAVLFGVTVNQSVTDFPVVSHDFARTHFSKPPGTDLIGKSAEAKYRDVNRPPFPRQRLDEITRTTGAVMLPKWFIVFDLDLTRSRTGPLMAVPCVAIHGKGNPRKLRFCDVVRESFLINAEATSMQASVFSQEHINPQAIPLGSASSRQDFKTAHRTVTAALRDRHRARPQSRA